MYMDNDHSLRTVLATHKAGDILGAPGCFQPGVRPAHVVAAKSCMLALLPYQQLEVRSQNCQNKISVMGTKLYLGVSSRRELDLDEVLTLQARALQDPAFWLVILRRFVHTNCDRGGCSGGDAQTLRLGMLEGVHKAQTFSSRACAMFIELHFPSFYVYRTGRLR